MRYLCPWGTPHRWWITAYLCWWIYRIRHVKEWHIHWTKTDF